MTRTEEQLFGGLFALTFPMVMGFAVSVSIYVDGLGPKSFVMLATWLAATCFLWSLPRIAERLGWQREIARDERSALIVANSALMAHGVTWLFFIAVCVAACWRIGTDGAVSVNVLPLALVGGAVVFQVVFVLTSLFQEKTSPWPVKS